MTQNKSGRQRGYVDYTLIFIILLLIGFGLIMVYSTSSYSASVTAATNNDPVYYLRKQVTATIFGLVAMVITAIIPYQFWQRFDLLAYIVAAFLVFLVLTPLGYEANGARRWLRIGISVQPAEIAKLALIIFLASLVCKMGSSIKTRRGFGIVLASPLLISFMVVTITDNLSSAIIIYAICVIMLFVANPDYKPFLIAAAAVAAFAALTVFLITKTEGSKFWGFRGARVRAWLNPEAYATSTGYQTLQALYAIGSGGTFGKGLGQSTQKLGFIPEAQNDMIFSIICEELGLFGGICIVVLFILLLWRMMIIANNAPDLFGGLLVVGVMGHIAVQVVLNIAVVTNTIPNTGISLPFISYGGSSVVFLLIEMGLVFSVGRSIFFKED